ncbi:HK97 family phage major capsid protein [Cupriavidus phytorum]|uniref:HK97 family phage major capsid protein n=1 Tax=Cupriavidus phytorum TaxID=3024399 RepID=A0A2W7R263_9BURK|nr:phage major capsid protein [Cupriavidus alkaliphilus]PZX32052.1 HK97 family phage major capsid protein [Cupriavidus alkaliphilus]
MKKTKFAAVLTAIGATVHDMLFRHMQRSGMVLAFDENDVKEIKASLGKISDDVKAAGEKALKEAQLAAGKLSEETKAKVDELLTKQGEMQANLQHAQQALAKLEANGAGGDVQHQSFGQQFVGSDDFKAFTGKTTPRGRVDMTFNAAITTVATDTDGAAGDLVQNTRLPGIIAPLNRRLTVRDLITPGRMDGQVLEYVKETGFTNNAAPVAETVKKPESTMKFDLVTTSAKVIAHFVKASRQILSDASQLASYIDGRLRYGLALVEENQLLNGDGTGQNLLGIIPQATAFAAPFDPAGTETGIDNIRLAMLQAALAEFPATGIVMHPSDWARIELLKDTTGRYIIGNPQGTISPTLWGQPVVATQAITVDKFLVGAFKLGAQVFDRWQARVEVATENEDDFVKNLVTILAEERLALAVYRPQAFVYGDFGNVA